MDRIFPKLRGAANLAAIVAVVGVFTAEKALSKGKNMENTTEGTRHMNVMVDLSPASPNAGTSLAASLCPLMASLGRPDWTMARLQGVMGHAFQFDMNEGGNHVNHDHLDWGPALEVLPQIAAFRQFGGKPHQDAGASLELKQEARDAVRASLERGIPALAWSPMGPQIKAAPGPKPVCWGLIVGYNEADETYTARHPWVEGTYTVRYDALGTTNDKWFNIRVFDQARQPDLSAIHLRALRHAIGLATETRYEEGDQANANRRAIPHGFSAYEVWRAAFESEDPPLGVSKHHTYILRARRSAAAEYMRHLAESFPLAKESLQAAAAAYDRELEYLDDLSEVCLAASANEAWTPEAKTDARGLISNALVAEREAVASIQSALVVLDKDR